MTHINILGVDAGLRRAGCVLVQTDGIEHVALRADTFESELRAEAFGIALADDRVRRSREFHRWLCAFTRATDIQLVAAEAMSFPRGAHAITALCLAWGVMCAFVEARDLVLVSATPSHWRSFLIGRPDKRERGKVATARRERAAHAEVVRRMPSIVPLVRRLRGERQLHALDAAGVGLWSTSTPEARGMLR